MSVDILKRIRNNIIISVADAVENHVDGRDVMKEQIRPVILNLLKNEKDTDKVLRGPVTDFLKELFEGIWGASTCANIENWQHNINTRR